MRDDLEHYNCSVQGSHCHVGTCATWAPFLFQVLRVFGLFGLFCFVFLGWVCLDLLPQESGHKSGHQSGPDCSVMNYECTCALYGARLYLCGKFANKYFWVTKFLRSNIRQVMETQHRHHPMHKRTIWTQSFGWLETMLSNPILGTRNLGSSLSLPLHIKHGCRLVCRIAEIKIYRFRCGFPRLCLGASSFQ